MNKFSILTIVSMLFGFVSCSSQEKAKETSQATVEQTEPLVLIKEEPHQYGGWYCPDNFGFVPVDIHNLDEVPAIAGRLPSEEELQNNKSLISVDTIKYPDARALDMELPRVGRIYAAGKSTSELVIVIQAIIVSGDTIVGYRFPSGGNGSAWLSEVSFLSDDELDGFGSQPFFYSKSILKASKEDIWRAIGQTDYFKKLGEKFDNREFFASEWTSDSHARLNLDDKGEQAKGNVGTVFGNVYLQIDYNRDGLHYSEKLLMIEHQEDNSTELFFASGPFPQGFEKQKSNWDSWVEAVKKMSEAN